MKNPIKIILIFFVCLAIFLTIWAKFLGAYIETPVEKQGYCKILYGENFRLAEDRNECYVYDKREQMIYSFIEEDFRNYCSKPNFISTTFWNKCFYANKGDFIN